MVKCTVKFNHPRTGKDTVLEYDSIEVGREVARVIAELTRENVKLNVYGTDYEVWPNGEIH